MAQIFMSPLFYRNYLRNNFSSFYILLISQEFARLTTGAKVFDRYLDVHGSQTIRGGCCSDQKRNKEQGAEKDYLV